MGKSSGTSKGGSSTGKGDASGGKGGYPSTTGNASGGGRTNGPRPTK